MSVGYFNIVTHFQPVANILMRGGNTVAGVVLEDGSEVKANAVLSNATPKVTYLDLLPKVGGAKETAE